MSVADLMIKHQLWTSICRGVLAQEHPRVRVNVVAIEVAFQRLAVPHGGIQIASQSVDLPPLNVNAHLVTRPGARATLMKKITREKEIK